MYRQAGFCPAKISFIFHFFIITHYLDAKSLQCDVPLRVQFGLWPLYSFPFRCWDLSQLGHISIPYIHHTSLQHQGTPSTGQIRRICQHKHSQTFGSIQHKTHHHFQKGLHHLLLPGLESEMDGGERKLHFLRRSRLTLCVTPEGKKLNITTNQWDHFKFIYIYRIRANKGVEM